MNQNIITIITECGGREWQKYGKHRIYLDAETAYELAGGAIDFYKTGNVSSATLPAYEKEHGSLSNRRAYIESVYYDVEYGTFHARGNDRDVVACIIAQLTAWLKKELAQLDVDENPEEENADEACTHARAMADELNSGDFTHVTTFGHQLTCDAYDQHDYYDEGRMYMLTVTDVAGHDNFAYITTLSELADRVEADALTQKFSFGAELMRNFPATAIDAEELGIEEGTRIWVDHDLTAHIDEPTLTPQLLEDYAIRVYAGRVTLQAQ